MGHNITIPNVHTDVNGRLLQADARLIRVAEHIGTFLKDGQMRRPNAWRDLVPYSTYEPFNGESQTTNIFRGTLGEQSGLSAWAKVEASRRGIAGTQEPVDACSYQPKTYDWAIESLSYTGYKRSWKSPVLCVRDFYVADKAKEQLAMILKAGSAVVDDTRVTFQREMYMYFAALAGHFVVMTSGFNDFIDDTATRVSFDPFVDDADGDEVLTFDASLLPNISTLNWDYLDYCKQWLTDMAPEGAFGMDSGMPMFMAMMDKNEFEQMVYNDANLREDFRYAKPQMLIEGFNMGFKTYRGIIISHDPQQPRWALKGIDGGSATLKRVNPRRLGDAVAIGQRPETNPDYLNAEFGTIIFYLKSAYTILVPRVLTSLGSGTSFGDGPAFNGEWQWVNNKDMDKNILGEIGYFFARFEYHPRPEDNAANAIVLLYRRCVTPRVTRCDTDSDGTAEITTATTVRSITNVNGTGFADATTFAVTMPSAVEVSVGSAVTITDTDSSETISGYIADTVSAPVYTVMIQTANASFTSVGPHTITKTA